MSRECGDCTLCCKVLRIEAEGFASAQGEWCVHCDKAGGGCRIYDTRPEECDLFSCLWLQQPELPEELKPSRCRVVIGWYDDMFYLYVDPGRRDAWQRAPVDIDVAVQRQVGEGLEERLVDGIEYQSGDDARQRVGRDEQGN